MTIDDPKTPPQTETPPVVDDGAPTDPITIDVESGEPAAEPAAAAAEPPKKKTGGRLQAKIDHERALRGAAETTAQRLERENQELSRQLEETRRAHAQADQAALTHFEESVKTKLANAKKALTDATNAGDAEKIAEATAEVSKWASEEGRLETWKSRQQPQTQADGDDEPTPQRERPQAQQPQAQQPQFTQEMRDFLADNPWFVPGTRENPNPAFDVEMHKFARMQGGILEQRYRRQGKDPNSKEYFDELARMTREEFGYEDDGEDEAPPAPAPKRAAPRMQGDETVTPARATQAAPNARPNSVGTKITLSPEERAMARAMVDGGVYKKPDGKSLTYAEAEVRFAKAVHRDRVERSQRGA